MKYHKDAIEKINIVTSTVEAKQKNELIIKIPKLNHDLSLVQIPLPSLF